MNIKVSDIVLSTAGRDKGLLFFVLSLDYPYLVLSDGKVHRLENPKHKKYKHVIKVSQSDSRVAQKIINGDKLQNNELRRELAVYGQKFICQNQGGN